jgi:hypothetical protein
MEVKKREPRSWLSATTGPAIAAAFGERLSKRLEGKSGVFVTLTYDRENWSDAYEVYRAAGEERHVRLFIRRLGEYLGESLRGRWACKMEFQEEGWVHWHLVLVGVKRIPHDDLTELWGRGHVWINRLQRKRVAYFAKYVAKAGQGVPGFLLAERRGSVKVVRVSPGFWDEPSEKKGRAREDHARVRYPWYVAVGEVLEDPGSVLVRFATGRFAQLKADFFQFLITVRAWGGRLSGGSRRSWLRVDGLSWDRLQDAAMAASAASGLHLTNASDPHKWGPPRWVWEFLRWRYGD